MARGIVLARERLRAACLWAKVLFGSSVGCQVTLHVFGMLEPTLADWAFVRAHLGWIMSLSVVPTILSVGSHPYGLCETGSAYLTPDLDEKLLPHEGQT